MMEANCDIDCWLVAEVEILADGLHILLIDPYNDPKLKVRYPTHQNTKRYADASLMLLSCMCATNQT